MHIAMHATVPEEAQTCEAVVLTDEPMNGLVHIYGSVTLPEGQSQAPDYYVTLIASDGIFETFRAYNCYETEKFGEDAILDNGYSLYVPERDMTGVQCVVQAIF